MATQKRTIKMTLQTGITRKTGVTATGRGPRPGMYEYVVELSAVPTQEWIAAFKNSGMLISPGTDPSSFSFSGNTATFATSQDKVPSWVTTFDTYRKDANEKDAARLKQEREDADRLKQDLKHQNDLFRKL